MIVISNTVIIHPTLFKIKQTFN